MVQFSDTPALLHLLLPTIVIILSLLLLLLATITTITIEQGIYHRHKLTFSANYSKTLLKDEIADRSPLFGFGKIKDQGTIKQQPRKEEDDKQRDAEDQDAR